MRPVRALLWLIPPLLVIGLGVIGLALGWWWSRGETEAPSAGVTAIEPLNLSLPDLQGTLRQMQEWEGKVRVVNFWATWCPPCRDEIPAFIRLQDEYGPAGLQIIGIALDEHAEVVHFREVEGINYPLLIGGLEIADLLRLYGNEMGGLPFTLVLDAQGSIVERKLGPYRYEELKAVVAPLLAPALARLAERP